MKMVAYRRTALAALAALLIAAPTQAARNIAIDKPSNTNTLTSCSQFAGCLQLSLSGQSSSPVSGSVLISPTGFIEFTDTRGGSAHFSAAESAQTYQVLSGYTTTGAGDRTDFISFYTLGASTTPLSNGNRPDPAFQIQFRTLTTRNPAGTTPFLNDLEIAYAYDDGGDVAAGASIGYRGAALGTGPGAGGFGVFGGFPAQRFVTNENGLLLGTQPGDSEFAFAVGNYPDSSFRTVPALTSQTFDARYAAAAPVPEPATWGMLVLGFGAVGATLRRRRVSGAAALT